jgi:hypothetical protein
VVYVDNGSSDRSLERRNLRIPLTKRLGNQLISALFNLLFRQGVTDLYTGCKALNRSVLRRVNLQRQGFEHVLELAAKLARKNTVVKEIAIDFTPRYTETAKMKHLSETLKCLYLVVYYFLTVRTNG